MRLFRRHELSLVVTVAALGVDCGGSEPVSPDAGGGSGGGRAGSGTGGSASGGAGGAVTCSDLDPGCQCPALSGDPIVDACSPTSVVTQTNQVGSSCQDSISCNCGLVECVDLGGGLCSCSANPAISLNGARVADCGATAAQTGINCCQSTIDCVCNVAACSSTRTPSRTAP